MTNYPPIVGGASLLIALSLSTKLTLIIGADSLAAIRATAALQADSKVLVAFENNTKDKPIQLSEELIARRDQGELEIIEFDGPDHLLSLLDDGGGSDSSSIAVAFITDTLIGNKGGRRSYESASALRSVLKRRNILVNVSDMPSLCDFTLPACHRFTTTTTTISSTPSNPGPRPSSLQIAVTTNGRGCRLATRIRREIVSRLPSNIGNAVETVAALRERAKQNTNNTTNSVSSSSVIVADGEDSQPTTPNEPVPQPQIVGSSKEAEGSGGYEFVGETEEEGQRRRMRWVAQMSEYWPLDRLASLDPSSLFDDVFRDDFRLPPHPPPQQQPVFTSETNPTVLPTAQSDPPCTIEAESSFPLTTPGHHALDLIVPPPTTPSSRLGKIYLLGSGPGHPGLLTVAAHEILTRKATVVLSDKLVPSEVLALVPKTTRVKIAKKFPGNAQGAQNELMLEAVEAALKGEIVVRLKQGDPAVYGRVGEEILYFRKRGFESIVVPGISSAIAGPMLAGIPVTQRGVAESVVVCTGVGRGGKLARLPGYVRSRTVVLLMGVARLESLLETLMGNKEEEEEGGGDGGGGEERGVREGEAYPPNVPIAVIERASMPDQRVVFATLESVGEAMKSVGEQRPPGMIVIGWSVLALEGEGDVEVLMEDAKMDDARIRRWLGGARWSVREGFVKWD